MQRWEYMTLAWIRHYGRTDYSVNGMKNPKLKDKVLAEVMNLLGEQGWELVAITDEEKHELTFKRPKVARAPQQAAQPPQTPDSASVFIKQEPPHES